jgi:hypothetical protein
MISKAEELEAHNDNRRDGEKAKNPSRAIDIGVPAAEEILAAIRELDALNQSRDQVARRQVALMRVAGLDIEKNYRIDTKTGTATEL